MTAAVNTEAAATAPSAATGTTPESLTPIVSAKELPAPSSERGADGERDHHGHQDRRQRLPRDETEDLALGEPDDLEVYPASAG